MRLKKISLKNIRSYEDAEIEFPEGSTVLSGDIGTGKTSILLAIEFALFGLQPGQRGSLLLRNDKNEGSVYLEVEVEGKEVAIKRGLQRKKSINQSYASIELDGKKQELSITELKNKVLELLQYPKEFAKKTNLLYRFTVYTPQEEMKQIILESPEIRLNTLRHVFGIDKYKRIKENTEIFTAKLREQIRSYEGQIKNLEELLEKLKEKQINLKKIDEEIEKLKQQLKERRGEREKSELELEEVEKKIREKERYEKEAEKTAIMLAGKKELLTENEKERSSLTKQIEEAKKIKFEYKELEEAKELMHDMEKSKEKAEKIYIEILGKINSLNSEIQKNEKLKEQISLLKLCPTCLQEVDEGYKENIIRRFAEDTISCKKEEEKLNNEKQAAIKKIELLKQEINRLRKRIEELNILQIKLEGLKEKETKISSLGKQKILTQNDISLLEKQILTLKQSSSSLKKYDNIYTTKKNELEEHEKRERETEIALASEEREKEMSIKIIQEIESEIEGKKQIKIKLKETAELEDWLSSSFLSVMSFTERNIMLKLREEFSKLFNEWFNILVPEIFSVRLDEDFTPVIEQQDFSLDYSFLSGGERTAIALAYRLSLNQVLNSLLSKIKTKDLVILDEPTDGFSEQQLDKMRDVLQELKVRQLIIVSHEPKIESFVQNIIKFRKEAGITVVES